ncbi:FGGY-family carbohydrate kinase [Paractinoplanes lichenicola]|uniref:Sugar kinase n=1 Tax=Paractinoplanes lichenicola TaxID=2802976 RepID=A0ABS1VUG9_9ACTN|nr:FGGY family carbohydrate kinase [Actinoplanes lichenicola]MBL7258087.1 sugar kinase [Actinoplanes lichenicola]
MSVFLGVDIGTSSSKGVLVAADGEVLRTAVREHGVDRPRPGHVEMAGSVWWDEFRSLAEELTAGVTVSAVGVSGMGPCVLLTDAAGVPLRPAILYGVDTRATDEIAALTSSLGESAILERCGSVLSSQAAGPKLAWLAKHEPDVMARARRLFMPASWLAYQLTGNYVLDFHSASQCTPLFDTHALDWYQPWASLIAPGLELPPLAWPGDVAGVTRSDISGIPAGTPVITGTIDAWTEAVSVGAQNPGDLMLMYGTTMFLIATVSSFTTSPSMWGTVGAFPGTRNLAGGMATSGAITSWLRDLTGASFPSLLAEAEASGAGARGLLMLPYFAGERTPVMDPDARGVIAGLTLEHTRGDLYRAALEATALGVRHNVAALREAGADIQRVVAVGGGTRGGLWTRIVSDVTGLAQVVPRVTIGAAYGAAFLAAGAPDINAWNPPAETVRPDPATRATYDELYALYLDLYPATRTITHSLADRQRRTR